MCQHIVLGLGANKAGPWGLPQQTAEKAIEILRKHRIVISAQSRWFVTQPVGQALQSNYVNAVLLVKTYRPPHALLRLLKTIEKEAGRRGGRPWGARTLDLDIIDFKGQVRHWDQRKKVPEKVVPGSLILPHPQAHLRPFVLEPLEEVAPNWRHPVLKKRPRDLLRLLSHQTPGQIVK